MVYKELIAEMDNLEDLLPGIEDFLCTVLAKESLTPEAEEQRLYFVERLDIIKLPPSVPPRPQTLGLKLYPITDNSLPNQSLSSDDVPEHDDFAAYQRELSRALVAKGNKSPLGSGEVEEVKVYDDIDSKDVSAIDESHSQIEDEDSMYEIPQLKRNLSDSGYEKAVDCNSLSKISESHASDSETTSIPAMPQPPPLPPRRERTSSNAASRSSIASMLEEKLGDISVKSKAEQQFSTSSYEEKKSDTKSEKSADELQDDYTGDDVDAVSVDSVDQDSGVKLPRAMKKKKHHHRVTHSYSAPLCDISNSFCDLEDVMLSGELYYRSTLLSTKNMVALRTNSLVCYKYEKLDSKPVLVIPLTGYRATFHKRNSRQSYEIQLCHDELDDHAFLTYFKEWAQTWCEYINCVADGRRVSGPCYSLVRSRNMEPVFGSTYDLTKEMKSRVWFKSNSQMFGSSVSVCSYDGLETGSAKAKKRHNSGNRQRIGSIVSRASQILDNFKLLKKSASVPQSGDQTLNIPEDENNGSVSVPDNLKDKVTADPANKSDSMKKLSIPETKGIRYSGDSVSEHGSSVSEPRTPLTPESGVFEPAVIETPTKVPKTVKHQGYLHIYSSFNKRKWGKRWCKVLENNFECYRNQTSTVCELDFLLRGCVLRRAIEETKSQLGLMLLENNREKITVEPMTWCELGSWLRVLMRETATPKPPEGLEGYMEEVNAYHDIVDDTREIELNTSTERQLSQGCETTNSRLVSDTPKTTKSSSSRNSYRDSGNCSGESTDGRSECLEKTNLHPEFSDTSLPRTAHNTGDIYTQVRKSSSSTSMVENQKDIQRHQVKHSSSKDKHNIRHSSKVPLGDINDIVDFDTAEDNLISLEREESMVDEVLSKFTSQIGTDFEDDDHEYEEFDNVTKTSKKSPPPFEEREHIYVDINTGKNEDTFVENRRLSRDLTELDAISPIKETIETKSSASSKHENFLCSSFVDDNKGVVVASMDSELQTSSRADEKNHSDSVVTNPVKDSNEFHLNTENSDHRISVDKTCGNNDLEKSGNASFIRSESDYKNPPSKQTEVCIEDLADVLSNLSLEDREYKESEETDLAVNKHNENIGDSKELENDTSGAESKVSDVNKATYEEARSVPLESELPEYLDEDARTRRSVVLREMAEMGGDIERTQRELRTKLVQLKKERISIHDRMQLTPVNGRVYKYLEDEYNRLNREVEKVNEEIACLDELKKEEVKKEPVKKEEKIEEKKPVFDDEVEEIDV